MNSCPLDQFLFIALPYVCLFTFLLMTIYRYRKQSFSYSSLSSQFLENKQHFWAVVPFHYGILAVTAGHLIAFLIPRTHPGVEQPSAAAVRPGDLGAGVRTADADRSGRHRDRRGTTTRIRKVTSRQPTGFCSRMLLVQTVSGVGDCAVPSLGFVLVRHQSVAVPVVDLQANPDISYVVAMPHLVKLHIVLAFLTIGFFPFTRLVHLLVIPNPYLWRKPQVVRWYGHDMKARTAARWKSATKRPASTCSR